MTKLIVGKKPPRGTECGLCADHCPTCGVKYAPLGDVQRHKPRCRNAARICGCENKAAIVVAGALPICRDHATNGWKYELLSVVKSAPGNEVASMCMDSIREEWFVTIEIKRGSSFLSALGRLVPLLPDHPSLSYGFTRKYGSYYGAAGTRFYKASIRKPRRALSGDPRRYCKHCSLDMPRVGQRLCRDRDGDLCEGVVRKNR